MEKQIFFLGSLTYSKSSDKSLQCSVMLTPVDERMELNIASISNRTICFEVRFEAADIEEASLLVNSHYANRAAKMIKSMLPITVQ